MAGGRPRLAPPHTNFAGRTQELTALSGYGCGFHGVWLPRRTSTAAKECWSFNGLRMFCLFVCRFLPLVCNYRPKMCTDLWRSVHWKVSITGRRRVQRRKPERTLRDSIQTDSIHVDMPSIKIFLYSKGCVQSHLYKPLLEKHQANGWLRLFSRLESLRYASTSSSSASRKRVIP